MVLVIQMIKHAYMELCNNDYYPIIFSYFRQKIVHLFLQNICCDNELSREEHPCEVIMRIYWGNWWERCIDNMDFYGNTTSSSTLKYLANITHQHSSTDVRHMPIICWNRSSLPQNSIIPTLPICVWGLFIQQIIIIFNPIQRLSQTLYVL